MLSYHTRDLKKILWFPYYGSLTVSGQPEQTVKASRSGQSAVVLGTDLDSQAVIGFGQSNEERKLN